MLGKLLGKTVGTVLAADSDADNAKHLVELLMDMRDDGNY